MYLGAADEPLDITVSDLAARQLKRDYFQGTPGVYFAEDHPPLELEEAYGVQAEVAKLRSVAGDSIAGYKVGCIGPKIREAFGMSGPISGILFTSELRPSGSAVSASKHTSLAIEGEMAVRIGVKDQIVCAFPVIELSYYVFRARVRSLSELVANNGRNAGVILPKLQDTTAHPLCPQSGKLEVRINDELTDWARCGACLAVRRKLSLGSSIICRMDRLSLQAGQIILTGTSLGLHHVRPSDRIQVFAEGYGDLDASIID